MEDYLNLFDNLQFLFLDNEPIEMLRPLIESNQELTSEQLEQYVNNLKPHIEHSNYLRSKTMRKSTINNRKSMNSSNNRASNDYQKSRTTSVFRKVIEKAPPIDEDVEEDRILVRGKLEEYYKRNKNGPNQLIDRLINVFEEMRFFSSSLQNQYQDLIRMKNQKTNDLEIFIKQLEEFVGKNPKILDNDSKIFMIDENDCNGLIEQDMKIPALNIKPNSSITTVNVIKNYLNSSSKTDDLKAQNKNLIGFFIKIYISIIYLTQRLCKTTNLINDISKEIPSSLIENMQSTIKRLEIYFHKTQSGESVKENLSSSKKMSQTTNIFNFFPESVEKDKTDNIYWQISTPKPLKFANTLAERSDSDYLIESNKGRNLERNNNNIKKVLIEIFENFSDDSINSLNNLIKEVIYI